MKDKLITIITVLIIGVLLVLMQSCKEDNGAPDEMEVFKNKICKTWKTTRVIHDDVEVADNFKTMTITFGADKTYKVANAAIPWVASGTYEIIKSNDNQFGLKRDDGVVIEVSSLNETGVILELLYTSSNGRVREISGHYRFEMTR